MRNQRVLCLLCTVVLLFTLLLPTTVFADEAAPLTVITVLDGQEISFEKNTELTFEFKVETEKSYVIGIEYRPLQGNGTPIELDYAIVNGTENAVSAHAQLPRLWKNETEIKTNAAGNQYAPRQVECLDWSWYDLTSSEALTTAKSPVALKAGTYTLKLKKTNEEPFEIRKITLTEYVPPKTYAEWKKENSNLPKYSGKSITLEGEAAEIKTTNSMVPKADNSNASLSPVSVEKDMMNYIGGSNWSTPQQRLTWNITVPEDGLYKIGVRFRQSYNMNGNCYRDIRIDGETPYAELAEVAFSYKADWQYTTLGDSKNGEYLIWLTEGTHTVSMGVTLGPISDVAEQLTETVYNLGDVYKQMIMVMGTTPDMNRDYRLFEQCDGLEELLKGCTDKLDSMSAQMRSITGKRGDSTTIVLTNMAEVSRRMLKDPYRAQRYKDDFYSNYCSIGALLYEIQSMPLDIDTIVFSSPDSEDDGMAGFWEQSWYSLQRFFASFVQDYNQVSGAGNGKQKSITLWLYWGRDQTQVLNNLIEESFTPQTGIFVNVKIVNASLIQAMLAGDGPDVSLRLSRTGPVDMAMRGALYDLTQFDDYEEVLERFQPNAELPYIYNGKCYALPDTQTFYMMFYRKDILDEYGLEVPTTWEEFHNVATILAYDNLLVGIPYTKISDLNVPSAGIGALSIFPSMLLQRNGSIYNKAQTATNLTDNLSVDVFAEFTKLYTDRGYPVSFDFYNRFRTGEMPLGIAPYTQYNSLAVAAKEIKGRWGMAPIPGTVTDGVLNNTSAGGGSGSVILKQSKDPESAWEFLKWWTSAETQYRYSSDIESILGAAERQATANVEAFSRLPWETDDLKALQEQFANVTEIPEVPGSYYTVRSLDQAFWSVYNNGKNPRNAISTWSQDADDEIKRKRDEYGLN